MQGKTEEGVVESIGAAFQTQHDTVRATLSARLQRSATSRLSQLTVKHKMAPVKEWQLFED